MNGNIPGFQTQAQQPGPAPTSAAMQMAAALAQQQMQQQAQQSGGLSPLNTRYALNPRVLAQQSLMQRTGTSQQRLGLDWERLNALNNYRAAQIQNAMTGLQIAAFAAKEKVNKDQYDIADALAQSAYYNVDDPTYIGKVYEQAKQQGVPLDKVNSRLNYWLGKGRWDRQQDKLQKAAEAAKAKQTEAGQMASDFGAVPKIGGNIALPGALWNNMGWTPTNEPEVTATPQIIYAASGTPYVRMQEKPAPPHWVQTPAGVVGVTSAGQGQPPVVTPPAAGTKLEIDTQKLSMDLFGDLHRDPLIRKAQEGNMSFEQIKAQVAEANALLDQGLPVPAASDIAMIYTFMRSLDPTSTVREGEYATARNAAGVPERIRNYWNTILAGNQLSPTMRNEFLRAAELSVSGIRKQAGEVAKIYVKRGGLHNIPPEHIDPSGISLWGKVGSREEAEARLGKIGQSKR